MYIQQSADSIISKVAELTVVADSGLGLFHIA